MKILHTSDWHIGKKLHNQSLEEEHKLFFEWLFNIVEQEEIDMLIVAGDIFDIAYPSASALELYYQTLSKLSRSRLKKIIITAGNHDSASNINAPKELLKYMNITAVGNIKDSLEDILVFYPDKENPEVVVCAVPFLRDRDIRKASQQISIESKAEQYRAGTADFFAALAKHVEPYKNSGAKIIVTGHLFVKNAEFDAKEREKYSLGGIYDITTEDFPAIFDYVALGHIHRAYPVDKNKKIRYSGNPVKMSFDENDKKKIIIIDTGNMESKEIEVPVFRDKIRLQGDIDQIEEILVKYENKRQLSPAWAEIIINSQEYDPLYDQKIKDLNQKLDNITIIDYKIIKPEQDKNPLPNNETSLKDITPTEIFVQYLEQAQIGNKEELIDAFKQLINNLYQ